MVVSAGRRSFLRGRLREVPANPTRPPWAVPNETFTVLCTRCDDCVAACPENIIFAGDGGFPEISFKNGECTFCGDCVTACMPKALLKVDGRAPWTLKARILEDKCLTYQGVTCRVCGERCDAGAISFASARGQTERININQGICTGCGACFYPCPAEAVEVSPGHPLEPQAEEPSKRRP